MRRGSANSDGARTSVARIWPLRSTMSGRAVETALLRAGAAHDVAFRHHREHDEAHRDHRIDRRRRPGSRGRRARAPWRGGRRSRRRAACGSAAGATARPALRRSARSAACASASIGLRRPGPAACRAADLLRGTRAGRRIAVRILDHRGDRVVRRRLHDLQRALRQTVERVELRRLGRAERQMPPHQALDARRIFQRAPIRRAAPRWRRARAGCRRASWRRARRAASIRT